MFTILFIFTTLFTVAELAKILVVVLTPSISHQIVFYPVLKELLKRDHEVTFITTDPMFPQGGSPNKLKEIDLHDLSYKLWNEVYDAVAKNYQSDLLSLMTLTARVLHEVFEEQLKDKSVKRLIEEKTVKFDLLILEECAAAALIFSHIFNAPVVLMGSFGENGGSMNAIGAVSHPLLYPTQFHQRLYNLTIWEKMSELYNHMAFKNMFHNLHFDTDRMLQNLFGIDIPTIKELRNNVNILCLYTHPIWLHNQPVPPNYLHIWGIHRAPEKMLPRVFQDYLDTSKNGVIYFSFGTNIKTSTLAPKALEILLKVFSRLPYNILWKWDEDELVGKSDNIKISKWFPQYDVLRHPNVKLFITQGGLQSTNEAINAGVPVIGFPQFSDQYYTAEKYEYFKIGMKLQLQSLTVETFENAIITILKDYDSYRKNIIRLRTLIHNQPKPPLESAVWWTEYVLRHGGAKQLRTPAANMSFVEYYELELVFILVTGILIVGATLSKVYSIFIKFLLYRITSLYLKK